MRIFGFVARGDDQTESDVDFLVDIEARRSPFDLGGLLTDLQQLLNRRVDVVAVSGLRARIRGHVLPEAKPLWGAFDIASRMSLRQSRIEMLRAAADDGHPRPVSNLVFAESKSVAI